MKNVICNLFKDEKEKDVAWVGTPFTRWKVLNYKNVSNISNEAIVEACIIVDQYATKVKAIPIENLKKMPGKTIFFPNYIVRQDSAYYIHEESEQTGYYDYLAPFEEIEIKPGAKPGLYKKWELGGDIIFLLKPDGTFEKKGLITDQDKEVIEIQLDPKRYKNFFGIINRWLDSLIINKELVIESIPTFPEGIKVKIETFERKKSSGFYFKQVFVPGGNDGYRAPAHYKDDRSYSYLREDLMKVLRIYFEDENGNSHSKEYEKLLEKGEEKKFDNRRYSR